MKLINIEDNLGLYKVKITDYKNKKDLENGIIQYYNNNLKILARNHTVLHDWFIQKAKEDKFKKPRGYDREDESSYTCKNKAGEYRVYHANLIKVINADNILIDNFLESQGKQFTL